MKRNRIPCLQGHCGYVVVGVIAAVILVIAAQLRPPCLWTYLVLKRYPKLAPEDRTDVTLVSAYFNLGYISEDKLGYYKYMHWAQVFQFAMNPLVFYTDSKEIAKLLSLIRPADRTKVIYITRSDIKAFESVERIRSIFRDPNYPKHNPNTVIAEYPCTQHAKYELVRRTLDAGFFADNKYVAWIDVGYFRYLMRRQRQFYVTAPPGLDDSSIAMTEVSPPDYSLFPSDIFRENLFWVGGGMSLGTRSAYRQFANDYERNTELFLQQGLSNTDQQVIYSMFTKAHSLNNSVKTVLKTYRWPLDAVCHCWFYLGYLCYKELD